jgi:site-specific recombinase XerC
VRALRPDAVTVTLVEGWLKAHPKWKASRRHAIQTLLHAFNWGVKRGRLSKNPIAGIDVPTQRRVLSYLTAEQRTAVFAATLLRTALSETSRPDRNTPSA